PPPSQGGDFHNTPSPSQEGDASLSPPPLQGGGWGVVARRLLPLALLLIGALLGVWHLRSLHKTIARQQQQEDTLRKPGGLWFRESAGPDERILLEPIGYVGYFSQRRILDLVGLVSPEVFPSYSTPHPLTDIVRRLRPEWLYLRPSELAQ